MFDLAVPWHNLALDGVEAANIETDVIGRHA
jgi:hypothetical protein